MRADLGGGIVVRTVITKTGRKSGELHSAGR